MFLNLFGIYFNKSSKHLYVSMVELQTTCKSSSHLFASINIIQLAKKLLTTITFLLMLFVSEKLPSRSFVEAGQ